MYIYIYIQYYNIIFGYFKPGWQLAFWKAAVSFLDCRCRRRELLRDPRDWVVLSHRSGLITPSRSTFYILFTTFLVVQVAMSSLGHVQLWTETLGLLEAGDLVALCARSLFPLLRQAMYSEMGFVAVQAFNATISATESCWRSLVQISSNHCWSLPMYLL